MGPSKKPASCTRSSGRRNGRDDAGRGKLERGAEGKDRARPTLILGIETSCDETSAAVVRDGVDIRSNVVLSQVDRHKVFGGVVPEMAARAHAERITAIIDEAMAAAKCAPREIDAVAVVNRPGLVGALLAAIALAPLLFANWWARHYPKVALALGARCRG